MDDLGGTPIFGNIHVDMDLLENLRGSIWSFWPLDPPNPWTQPFLPSLSVINGARAYLRTTQSWNAGVFSLLCSVVLTSLDFDNEFISSTETNELSYCQQNPFLPVTPSQCGSNSIQYKFLDFLRRKKKDLFWHRRNMLHACFEKSSFILFIAIKKVTPNRTKTHFFLRGKKKA